MVLPTILCLICVSWSSDLIPAGHFFISIYGIFFIVTQSIRDIRICILFFSLVYSLLISLSFFLIGSLDIGQGGIDLFKKISSGSILFALKFNVYWIAGLLLHLSLDGNFLHISLISERVRKGFKVRSNQLYVSSPKLLVVFLFWISSLSFLDWERISREYTLEGVGLSFGLSYILFALIISRLLKNKALEKVDLIILFSVIVIFAIIGARQPLLWGLIMIFVAFLFNNNSLKYNLLKFMTFKKFLKILVVSFFIIVLGAMIVWYRVTRETEAVFSFIFALDINFVFSLFVRLFVAETVFTFYNLLAIAEKELTGVLGFWVFFWDLFLQIIPTPLFNQKYNYMETYNVVRENELAPFGTTYVAGTLALFSPLPIFTLVFSFFYCTFIKYTMKAIFAMTKSPTDQIVIYCVFYVFSGAYIVRGSIFGGFKLALTVSVAYLIIKTISNMKFYRFRKPF